MGLSRPEMGLLYLLRVSVEKNKNMAHHLYSQSYSPPFKIPTNTNYATVATADL
jgi:hypothetical protein